MGSSDWDPTQYSRFAAERAQPFYDLIDLYEPVGPAPRLADLGCGDGKLTAVLAERVGAASVLAIDSSPAMLAALETEQSASRSDRRQTWTVELGDIATWGGGADFDLIVANASLQWVPDHPAVLARWLGALAPGGQLAVQVPANGDHASHIASVEVAHREPFLSAMGGTPPPDVVTANVLAPEQYSQLLFDLGVDRQHVRLQVYPHVLDSTAAVVEWVRGTSLTRFFKVLPAELHEPFVDAYRQELLARLGDRSPYLYAFKRILIWARVR